MYKYSYNQERTDTVVTNYSYKQEEIKTTKFKTLNNSKFKEVWSNG